MALAGIEKFARSGHGRFNRPDASVMRPASQRFKRIVPIASRPRAQGSDDSVVRVTSSISVAADRRRPGNARKLGLDEALDDAAEQLGQRFDFAAHQNERHDRKHAGKNRGDGNDAPDRVPFALAVCVPAEQGEARADDAPEAPC